MTSSSTNKTLKVNQKKIYNDLLTTAKKIRENQIDSYNKESNQNWFLFLVYYIVTVKKLVKDLPEDSDTSNSLDENRATIVPTIYLFRHTLELLFKFAQITFEKNIGNHDINKIKRNFHIEKIITKLSVKKIAESINLGTEETKTHIRETFESLESLSDDYFFGHFLYFSKDNLDLTIIDKENELFKYPVNYNVNIQVSPLDLYGLNGATISKIKEDIIKVEEIFNNLNIYFGDSDLK